MNTHVPSKGFICFSAFLHHFVLAKLAISSIFSYRYSLCSPTFACILYGIPKHIGHHEGLAVQVLIQISIGKDMKELISQKMLLMEEYD